jgi:hypothetical protein
MVVISSNSKESMRKCRKVWLINPRSRVSDRPRPARVNAKKIKTSEE